MKPVGQSNGSSEGGEGREGGGGGKEGGETVHLL